MIGYLFSKFLLIIDFSPCNLAETLSRIQSRFLLSNFERAAHHKRRSACVSLSIATMFMIRKEPFGPKRRACARLVRLVPLQNSI